MDCNSLQLQIAETHYNRIGFFKRGDGAVGTGRRKGVNFTILWNDTSSTLHCNKIIRGMTLYAHFGHF